MSVDPIQQIIAARPRIGDVPTAGEGVVATQGEVRRATNFAMGDLNDLSAIPGSNGHQTKMAALRQQAISRGDPEELADLNKPALILPDAPASVEVVGAASLVDITPRKRVAIYYGRGDTYNLVVETSPDWETETMLKALEADDVRMLLNLVKALDVRLADKTGDFS